MEIIYHENLSIPKLAWCAVAVQGEPKFHVYHGSGIETFDNFFV